MGVSLQSKGTIRSILDNNILDDVDDLINSKQWWMLSRNAFDGLAQVFNGVALLLAFAASSITITETVVSKWLAFASGACATLSMICQLLSSYSEKTSRKRLNDLNHVLRIAQVTPLVEPRRHGFHGTHGTHGPHDDPDPPDRHSFDSNV